ncbi:hypothetical protein H696_05274 [Fonticula alba]|uniref:Uncharacterized protein n=1 Tax=Fonticula alba TaxID=691883 RepID=A0A058Z353_FONAL|nr:hypothetical protein H696_05274 [Fonticula alba]KCV68358.1 hypothetical protein H696_05274 [Fonticula alba]|eukprot:XP_009497412.1 hypothetical protein H696_05274 [Fonticula alba]
MHGFDASPSARILLAAAASIANPAKATLAATPAGAASPSPTTAAAATAAQSQIHPMPGATAAASRRHDGPPKSAAASAVASAPPLAIPPQAPVPASPATPSAALASTGAPAAVPNAGTAFTAPAKAATSVPPATPKAPSVAATPSSPIAPVAAPVAAVPKAPAGSQPLAVPAVAPAAAAPAGPPTPSPGVPLGDFLKRSGQPSSPVAVNSRAPISAVLYAHSPPTGPSATPTASTAAAPSVAPSVSMPVAARGSILPPSPSVSAPTPGSGDSTTNPPAGRASSPSPRPASAPVRPSIPSPDDVNSQPVIIDIEELDSVNQGSLSAGLRADVLPKAPSGFAVLPSRDMPISQADIILSASPGSGCPRSEVGTSKVLSSMRASISAAEMLSESAHRDFYPAGPRATSSAGEVSSTGSSPRRTIGESPTRTNRLFASLNRSPYSPSSSPSRMGTPSSQRTASPSKFAGLDPGAGLSPSSGRSLDGMLFPVSDYTAPPSPSAPSAVRSIHSSNLIAMLSESAKDTPLVPFPTPFTSQLPTRKSQPIVKFNETIFFCDNTVGPLSDRVSRLRRDRSRAAAPVLSSDEASSSPARPKRPPFPKTQPPSKRSKIEQPAAMGSSPSGDPSEQDQAEAELHRLNRELESAMQDETEAATSFSKMASMSHRLIENMSLLSLNLLTSLFPSRR